MNPSFNTRRPIAPCLLILVAALSVTVMAAQRVSAQSTVAVSPGGALLQGEPGQTLSGSVRLDNPASDAAAVTTSVQDFAYDQNGELTVYPAGMLPSSAASWVTLNPAGSTVAAGGHASVRYSVTVPADAKPGTHWAVVFFETGTANPPTTGKTLATFKVRVGFVVYVDVGNGTASGEIAGIVGRETRPGLQYEFAIQYQNSGDLVSLLNGKVDVRNSAGDTVVSIPIYREVALPDSVRLLKAGMVGPLPAGDYDALVVLDPNNVSQEVAGEFPFHLATALAAPPTPPTQNGPNGGANEAPRSGGAP